MRLTRYSPSRSSRTGVTTTTRRSCGRFARTNTVARLIACIALAACRPPGALPSPSAEWASGLFEFTIRSGSNTVVGTLQSRGGTITVTPRDGSCYLDRLARPEPEWVLFTCEGVSDKISDMKLRIDPWDPQGRSRWTGVVRSMVPRNECTAYGVDARGNRICIASRTLSVEQAATVSGSMILKPIVRG